MLEVAVGRREAGRWLCFVDLDHWFLRSEMSECLLRASNKRLLERGAAFLLAALGPFQRWGNRGAGT